MLQSLPKKTGDVRRKHVIVKDACEVEQKIEANNRTIPGILTNRGCAYAGSKGVVFGPIKDILHITHGPIGCAYFTWGSRRNLMSRRRQRLLLRLPPEHGRHGDGYRLWSREKAGFIH
jgi:nitrogenase molybdenum-iron protein alpha chain